MGEDLTHAPRVDLLVLAPLKANSALAGPRLTNELFETVASDGAADPARFVPIA